MFEELFSAAAGRDPSVPDEERKKAVRAAMIRALGNQLGPLAEQFGSYVNQPGRGTGQPGWDADVDDVSMASGAAGGAQELGFDPFELLSHVNGDMQPSASEFDPGHDDPEPAPAAGNEDRDGYEASLGVAGDWGGGAGGGMANRVGPGLTRVKKKQNPQDPYCDKTKYTDRGNHPRAGRTLPIQIPGAGVREFTHNKETGESAQLQMARAVRPEILRASWEDPDNPIEVGVKFYSITGKDEKSIFGRDRKAEEKFYYTNAITQHYFADLHLGQKLPIGAADKGDVHSHATLSCARTPGGNWRTSRKDRPSNLFRKNFVIAGKNGALYEVTRGGSYNKV